jgi:2-keto-4-pentenoate hydratase
MGAYLQALAEQLAGEIDVRNDQSTGEQIISYLDWAKEQAMGTARKLAELEARADAAPSHAQIEWWEKEVVETLKQEFHATFLASVNGVRAMEEVVRSVEIQEVTAEAQCNVVCIAENGILSNRGQMISVEKDARANLMVHFSVESNKQEDEWCKAYFDCLMEHLKGRHTDTRLC